MRKDCAGAISFGAASGCIAAGGATLLVGQSGNASNQQTSGLCHLRRGANRANQKKRSFFCTGQTEPRKKPRTFCQP